MCKSMSYTVSWCKNVMQSESVKLNSKQASSKQQQQQQPKTGNLYMKIIRTKNELKINNFNMIFVCDTIFMFLKVFCKRKKTPPTQK